MGREPDDTHAIKDAWAMGYSFPLECGPALRNLKRTNLLFAVFVALKDHFIICAAAAIGVLLYYYASIWLWLPANLAACYLIARCQRGFEVQVHDVCHYNWTRHTRLNDLLGNILVALPSFNLISSYRDSHRYHHIYFGQMLDPDRQRYEEFGIEELDRDRWLNYLMGMAAQLPTYTASWWKMIGLSPKVLVPSLGWHLVFLISPLAIIFGWRLALVIWAVYWLLPFMLILSVIRFIGEGGEHNYRASRTVFEGSNINQGLIPRLLVYAHGDGYHMIHHLFPSIPLHKLQRTHEFLIDADPHDYGLKYMHRTKIFQKAFKEQETNEEIERQIAKQIDEIALFEMAPDEPAEMECEVAVVGNHASRG
jgi:fatty acid desaturase